MRYTTISVFLLLYLLAACQGEPPMDLAAYKSEVQEWKAGRLERLKAPDGYLSLAGLFWLEEGRYSFGSDAASDFVFPESAPPKIGEFELTDDGVFMHLEEGMGASAGDEPATSMLLLHDTTGTPTEIHLGSLSWIVIERAGNFAVRLRDALHPAIEAFPPLEYYPIDPTLRVEGTLRRFDEPRVMNVETVIEGLGYHPESPGVVAFEVDGNTWELEAYDAGDDLFFVFGDMTSGKTTYPAGRFVYAKMPGEDGKTVLDFNKAYNPPCAFNDFATCPVASPRNRLKVAIEAGEMFDPDAHFTPGGKH
jgi:uncharacterized protein (DUF1684 family)